MTTSRPTRPGRTANKAALELSRGLSIPLEQATKLVASLLEKRCLVEGLNGSLEISKP